MSSIKRPYNSAARISQRAAPGSWPDNRQGVSPLQGKSALIFGRFLVPLARLEKEGSGWPS
jgi:hypothetical protein